MIKLPRKAVESDLPALCRLYASSIVDMESRGLDQWRWEVYPNETILHGDVEEGSLYLMEDAGEITAAFTINAEQPPQYSALFWHLGIRPAVLHRLVVAPSLQRKGIGRAAMEKALALAASLGYDSLRLDTYMKNNRAMALYEGLGMRAVGYVTFNERATPFQCYEMALTESCPLLPRKMRPAYRHGKDTPWGGAKLRTVFQKDIPDDRTGESLEISAIPGLESRGEDSMPLGDLNSLYGAKLMGTAVHGPFPLLLKLLDAREPLSVQVHPGDAYAAQNEGGKLGKTEAWLILQADKGAELIYGILPGTTREALEAASREGAAVEKLLRKVPVREGDVCFIPAGCVHAIGAGILLYEIQQSSDVTYRLYDWERVNEKGEKRPLHIEKALDVTDLSFCLDPIPRAKGTGVQPLLRNPVFTLDRLNVSGELPLPADPRRFSFLTALNTLLLCWEGDAMELKKGDSVLLPAQRPDIFLQGVGEAILSAPTVE